MSDPEAEIARLRALLEEREAQLAGYLRQRGEQLLEQVKRSREIEATRAHAATIDPVMGVLQHGLFHERLQFEARRAVELKRPLGVLVADLDRLADYNAARGYRAGDEALSVVGRTVRVMFEQRRRARPAVLGRERGDCFAIVLPYADREETEALAEAVRHVVERVSFGADRLTVSVGAAFSTGVDGRCTELLPVALAAQQRASKAGGNRVELA
ncbi:MAG: GGDEF domain-containing protein [Archangium sp.]|nr:GGDEF domain-containing protein [Archangium sp.]